MLDKCVFTIVSKNYFPMARVLFSTLDKFHPDIKKIVLLCDQPDKNIVAENEPFEIITVEQLGIEDFRALSFKYNVIELNTAVKPFFFKYLFETLGYRKAVYFDPDIAFYSDIQSILDALDLNSAVLTPHILSPIPDDGRRPRDIDILKVGNFNLGFLGLSATSNSLKLLQWWADRLYDKCLQAPLSGYGVDQIWMSMVPCFVPDYIILRDPGCNIAYWNLHERSVQGSEGQYSVNGKPLCFFHYSGFAPSDMMNISKYQSRFSLDTLGTAMQELFSAYADLLISKGYNEFRSLPYAYGHFSKGRKISEFTRGVFYGLGVGSEEFGDPFAPGFWWKVFGTPGLFARIFSMRFIMSMADKFLLFAWKRFYTG